MLDFGMYLSGLPAHAGPMACVFLAALWMTGVYLGDAAGEFVYLLPGLACGIALGHKVYPFMPQLLIRKVIIILLYAVCFYNIWKAV